jgi:hypothetical protein
VGQKGLQRPTAAPPSTAANPATSERSCSPTAATKAAAEDGEESPPPNDYYIRNVNSRLRTLPVRSDAPITVNVLAAGSTGSATKDVAVTLAELASYFPNSGTAPFWLTVDQGQVTKIAQQFLP